MNKRDRSRIDREIAWLIDDAKHHIAYLENLRDWALGKEVVE